ncbi:hypothetical protein ART_1569 [Arthrobacter sp. PAMC 25486]|uniref:hypothetical protein n=1 Tax=Arthrobacter sp. PAMC 25486 TaxID=1494608 RepID=UPI0005360D4C|nr:hypothetical protein [Arthrobacter sp. PAMC 25486]AIY01168.1 hypothetical protein ART_1569 [Arthrobacter sp. PAMC 25486]
MNNTKIVQAAVVQKIENHMAAKGITRKELKDGLNMGYERFRKRMSSEIPFSVEELWAIAGILRTSPLALMPEDAAEVHSFAA